MTEILVIVEHRKKQLTDTSLEVLSKGRQLADESGYKLLAAVIGKDIANYAARIANWADKVLALEDEEMEDSLAEPCLHPVSWLIKERRPKLVLISNSLFGMELAPTLAIETEAPLATDCTDIRIENDDIRVRRTIYNGKIEAEYSFVPSPTVLVTARPGQFPILEMKGNGEVEDLEFYSREETVSKKFEGYIEPEVAEIDITKYDILVSVGRGIKDEENLEMAQHLADVLGGALACSRPVVDFKWLPREHQVGISGQTVKPHIYLALGISGAFQHQAGMINSEIIIAINRDAKAPIFKIADYGIVDDIQEVIPALIEKISSK